MACGPIKTQASEQTLQLDTIAALRRTRSCGISGERPYCLGALRIVGMLQATADPAGLPQQTLWAVSSVAHGQLRQQRVL